MCEECPKSLATSPFGASSVAPANTAEEPKREYGIQRKTTESRTGNDREGAKECMTVVSKLVMSGFG